jgi:hypothetical protein
MSNNSNKSPFQEFAELMRFSTATLFAGIVAAIFMMQNPLIASFFGLAGIVSFILSIRLEKDAEKIERLLAIWGLTFSVMSLIFVLVNILSQSILSN